jgi:hypothetical protein
LTETLDDLVVVWNCEEGVHAVYTRTRAHPRRVDVINLEEPIAESYPRDEALKILFEDGYTVTEHTGENHRFIIRKEVNVYDEAE